MDFEEAVKAMEEGKICKSIRLGNNYRISSGQLQFQGMSSDWINFTNRLSDYFRDDWQIVEEKKTLSDKAREVDLRPNCSTWGYSEQDVKEAIKEFLGHLTVPHSGEFVLEKAKEIFGEKLTE